MVNEDYILQFDEYLENYKLSKSTLQSYKININDFTDYLLKINISIPDIKNCHVEEFIKHLHKDRKLTNATINVKISTLKKFFEFYNSYYSPSLQINIGLLKIKKRTKDLNFIFDIDLFIDSINHCTSNVNIITRDRLLFKFLYYTGIRTKEVLNLKPKNILNTHLELSGYQVIINNDFYLEVRDYIILLLLKDEDFLFHNYKPGKIDYSKPMTEKSVQEKLRLYSKPLDWNLSVLDLRQAYMKNLIENYAVNDIVNIQSSETIYKNTDFINSLNKLKTP